jgi:hypothetical protein
LTPSQVGFSVEPGAEILLFPTISAHFHRLSAIVAILGFPVPIIRQARHEGSVGQSQQQGRGPKFYFSDDSRSFPPSADHSWNFGFP